MFTKAELYGNRTERSTFGTQSHELIERRTFGTQLAAEMWAASRLEPVLTTLYYYHRDMGRAAYVRLQLPSGQTRIIEPEAVIVPCVGELGWTP